MYAEFKHSMIGSYRKPPDKITNPSVAYREAAPQDNLPKKLEPLSIPNSHALLLALKTLQDKIHRLELERTQAEDNLNTLSQEAALYKKALQNENNERNLAHQELIKQRKDISAQLSAAQIRCSVLEKQLELTKKVILNAEQEKNFALEQQQLQWEKGRDQIKLNEKLEKLEVLEKECVRLTTTQKTAEEKIKHLEQKLIEEEHQRKLIQDSAAQLQTGLEINRILMSSVLPSQQTKKKKSAKGKKSSKKGLQQTHSKFGAIGKSANESHFVNASVQTILNMTKHGNSPSLQACPEAPERRAISKRTVRCRPTSSYSSKSTSIGDGLTDLVMAMQDELDQMSIEHQELLKRVQESQRLSVNAEIEYELECLARNMEVKGEQICKLKKYQDHVNKLQQKSQNSKSEAFSNEPEDENYKRTKNVPVMVVTRKGTNKTKPPQENCSCHMPQNRFQKIQMTLRKDDIKWEQ
ncbi:centrosomal protein CEP57L1 isoform X1 [Phascolarctos cinereus]|uniref:Centrosomal protein 57kDa-like protein 1 n=1 Tax=Phascolarctos cinereus TaxID=38626 RepID=A0A6P5M5W8_PHACI|nr:centrosomal protein CEP57L1 isoform X1 [Phascolarctos cinereus]XP_020863875.1 centrosomal protein CEP57L1 isoform X1 [Phascolarctos cinereus]